MISATRTLLLWLVSAVVLSEVSRAIMRSKLWRRSSLSAFHRASRSALSASALRSAASFSAVAFRSAAALSYEARRSAARLSRSHLSLSPWIWSRSVSTMLAMGSTAGFAMLAASARRISFISGSPLDSSLRPWR